jgi:hypothetical protein
MTQYSSGTPTVIGAPSIPASPSLTPSQPGSPGLPQPGGQQSTLPNFPAQQACSAIICTDGGGDGPGIPAFGDPFGNFWNASRDFGDDLARRVGDWWNWLTGADKPHAPP